MSEEQENYLEEKAKKETAAIQKYAAIKAAGEDIISVSRVYVDMTGDIYAGLVLDELMYWTVPNKKRGQGLRVRKNGYLWLAVNRSEWWERKRLTEREADTAIQKLVKLGLVEKKVMLFNAKTTAHLRIIADKFFELYGAAMQAQLEDADENERKEISDLYEMMGMEKPAFYNSVEAELQIRQTHESQNRQTINNPILTHSPHLKDSAQPALPPLSIEWQIAQGVDTVKMQTEEQQKEAQIDLACMGICKFGQDLEGLAKAFMVARGIIPATKKDYQKWAVALREMKSNQVTPDNVTMAVQQLLEIKYTCSDPWSIKSNAIDLAHPAPSSPAATSGTVQNGVPYA